MILVANTPQIVQLAHGKLSREQLKCEVATTIKTVSKKTGRKQFQASKALKGTQPLDHYLAVNMLQAIQYLSAALKPRVYPGKFAVKCLELHEMMANDGRDQLQGEPWINQLCLSVCAVAIHLALVAKVDEDTDLRQLYSDLHIWDDARMRTLLYYLCGGTVFRIPPAWRPLIADLSVND